MRRWNYLLFGSPVSSATGTAFDCRNETNHATKMHCNPRIHDFAPFWTHYDSCLAHEVCWKALPLIQSCRADEIPFSEAAEGHGWPGAFLHGDALAARCKISTLFAIWWLASQVMCHLCRCVHISSVCGMLWRCYEVWSRKKYVPVGKKHGGCQPMTRLSYNQFHQQDVWLAVPEWLPTQRLKFD